MGVGWGWDKQRVEDPSLRMTAERFQMLTVGQARL